MVRTNDDLIDIAAGQHAECALMQVHDGQVGSPPLHHIIVRVQPDQQEIPLCPSQLQPHRKILSLSYIPELFCAHGKTLMTD